MIGGHQANQWRVAHRRATVQAFLAEVIRYQPERVQLWRMFAAEITVCGFLLGLDESDKAAVVRLVVGSEPLVDGALLRRRAIMVTRDLDQLETVFGVVPHDLNGVAAALVGIAQFDLSSDALRRGRLSEGTERTALTIGFGEYPANVVRVAFDYRKRNHGRNFVRVIQLDAVNDSLNQRDSGTKSYPSFYDVIDLALPSVDGANALDDLSGGTQPVRDESAGEFHEPLGIGGSDDDLADFGHFDTPPASPSSTMACRASSSVLAAVAQPVTTLPS